MSALRREREQGGSDLALDHEARALVAEDLEHVRELGVPERAARAERLAVLAAHERPRLGGRLQDRRDDAAEARLERGDRDALARRGDRRFDKLA